MKHVIQIESKELDRLIKSLGKAPVARVGVLGSKDMRKEKGQKTNAEIGARHEFGDDGMPIRSFLRVPIAENLSKYLEKADLYKADVLKEILKVGSLFPLIAKIGVIAESIVAEAFNTRGFGKWKPSIMKYKKVKQTLVETQQLRNSISSEVIE